MQETHHRRNLNGHIDRSNSNYERAHGGFGYGIRKKGGMKILYFATLYDLVIVNTCFRNMDEYLTTYKSRLTCTRIDFFLL